MPKGKRLAGATAKQQRQYEHIKASELERGEDLKTAKRIAAATTRKRAKNISGRVRFVSGEYKGMTGVILSIIQKRYSKEPTTYRIQIDGFPKPGGWNGKVTATENQIEPIKSNPKQSKGKAALKTTGRALKGAARGILSAGSSILGAGAKALNPRKKSAAPLARWEIYKKLSGKGEDVIGIVSAQTKAQAIRAAESMYAVAFRESSLTGRKIYIRKLGAVRFDNPRKKNKTIIKKAKKVIVLNKGKKAAKRNSSGSRFTDLSIGDKFRIPSFEEAVSKSLRGVTLIKISSTEARGPKKQVYNIRAQINVIKLAQNLDHKDSSHHAGQHDLFSHGIKAKPKRNPKGPIPTPQNHAEYKLLGEEYGYLRALGKKTTAESALLKKIESAMARYEKGSQHATGPRIDAAGWAEKMAKLQSMKPRPLAKLYGSRGPTPEQLATWKENMRQWNKAYRHASKMQKITLKEDNEAFRARQQNASRAVHSRKATAARGASSSSRKSRAPKSRKPTVKARKRKANPTAGEIRKEFAGRHTKNSTLYFPDGTPQGLAKLGKLVLIKTESGPIELVNRKGEVWLCADTNKKFHLGSTINAPLIDGPPQNFGQVKVIEYYESKPHMGYEKKVIWFHHMGEEGGRRPELISNSKGELKFKGGDYRITTRGIEN